MSVECKGGIAQLRILKMSVHREKLLVATCYFWMIVLVFAFVVAVSWLLGSHLNGAAGLLIVGGFFSLAGSAPCGSLPTSAKSRSRTMNDENHKSLRRINPGDLEGQLVNLDGLPAEKQAEIRSKLADNAVSLTSDAHQRFIKSRTAEHDMAMTMDQVKDLDHNKKIYSVSQNFETGAGNVKINIKGGDVNFIIPVLIVLGLIVLGVIFILYGR
jgi:hypothetical protein